MTEWMKAYHADWPDDDLRKARGDGVVTDDGEAWRYQHTHKDALGIYDVWFRHPDPLDRHPSMEDRDLRDCFAEAALVGLLSGFYAGSTSANLHEVPEEAFKIADAMLAARSATPEKDT